MQGIATLLGTARGKCAAVVFILASPLMPGTASAAELEGTPIQLASPNACIANAQAGGCTQSDGVFRPVELTIAADGVALYTNHVFGYPAFGRNPLSGALSFLATGPSSGTGNETPWSSAISPSGAILVGVASNNSTTNLQGTIDSYTVGANGALAQANCISEQVNGSCVVVNGIAYATGAAFPPSGPGLYVAARHGGGDGGDVNMAGDGALTAFTLDEATGAMTQLGCIPAVPALAGPCMVLPQNASVSLAGADDVVVSPDGNHVYAYSFEGIVGFARNSLTGALGGQVACIERTAAPPGCSQSNRLGVGGGLAISPDGKNVYAGGQGTGGLTVISRPPSGSLNVLECFNEGGGNGCTQVPSMVAGDGQTVVSPDGRFVYLVGQGLGAQGELRVFARDPADGTLSPHSCVSVAGIAGCAGGLGLDAASGVAVSPDGASIYVAATEGTADGDDGAIAIFRRAAAPQCQDASAAVDAGQDALLPLDCTDADGDPITREVTGAPAKGSLAAIAGAAVTYTANADASGTDSVVFTGSDGVNTSAPATVTVEIAAKPDDTKAPKSKLTAPGKRAKAAKLKKVKGSASDDVALAKVQVSVVRLLGGARAAAKRKRCAYLKKKGGFRTVKAKKGKCKPGRWIKAKGTAKWRLKLRKRLPKGSYLIASRAIDAAGNREKVTKKRKRNRRLVKVR